MTNCQYCDGKMKVIQTLQNPETEETYRLKHCTKCGNWFYTVEFEVDASPSFMKTWNACKNRKEEEE